jgi:hypothetical protein
MKLLLLTPFFSFLFLYSEADVIPLPNDAMQLEETFFLLDSVWTPGISNKYTLFPHDNYVHIKDGWVTVMVDEFRANSFKGPITGVKVEDVEGKRQTTFTVRSAKMRVELHELNENNYRIFMYKYLGSYERMFAARWIDVSMVEFEEVED